MLQPLGDRLVLKPSPEEEVTKGGIVLPDTAKKRPREGEVVAVGPGALIENGPRAGERKPMEVSVGDVVVYREFGGTEITIGDEDYVILESADILAINPDAKKKDKAKGKK